MTLPDRMTAKEYRRMIERGAHGRVQQPPAPASERGAVPRTSRELGRLAPGRMNKTEAAYAQHLEIRKHAGEIVQFHFEAVKFRLARRTFYTPDFLVVLTSGAIEMHEVKGHWEEDARVKIKVAAAMFPCFRFVVVKLIDRQRREWLLKEVTDGL